MRKTVQSKIQKKTSKGRWEIEDVVRKEKEIQPANKSLWIREKN